METGKTVAQHTYLHMEALRSDPSIPREMMDQAAALARIKPDRDFNVIKLGREDTISLLDYPGFFDEAFPVLKRYWTVDLARGTFRFRCYDGSLNPPILHRKELLLPRNYPSFPAYSALTLAAEFIGLFDDPRWISFLHTRINFLAFLRGRVQIIMTTIVPLVTTT